MTRNMIEEDVLAYYFHADEFAECGSPRSSFASSTSTSSSSSSKQSRPRLSFRQSLRLSSLFSRRSMNSSPTSTTRFSLPALTLQSSSSSSSMTLYEEPLSPKQLEIEQLISDYPDRTVKVSVTPEFAV